MRRRTSRGLSMSKRMSDCPSLRDDCLEDGQFGERAAVSLWEYVFDEALGCPTEYVPWGNC